MGSFVFLISLSSCSFFSFSIRAAANAMMGTDYLLNFVQRFSVFTAMFIGLLFVYLRGWVQLAHVPVFGCGVVGFRREDEQLFVN